MPSTTAPSCTDDPRLTDLLDSLPTRVDPESVIECSGRLQPRDNGGTVLAIAGEDYCLIAADTRLSDPGYRIHSRNVSRLLQVSARSVGNVMMT